ncbi:MAG: thiamine phosphate synthase [Pyrinomonadaceae bacterium]
MPLKIQPPILYLITSGATSATTTPASKEFQDILTTLRAAVANNISLFQIREKKLTARTLFELTLRAAEITAASGTRLLVNDRGDIARGAGADGVHLAANSIRAEVIRRTFGEELLIGVSTHSLAEVRTASTAGADFAVFGPVFETLSKREYGAPAGLAALQQAAEAVAPFPVLALGGVSLTNASECLRAGASGIAAINLFADPASIKSVVAAISAMTP